MPAARSAPIGRPVNLEGTPAEQADQVQTMLAGGALTLEEGHALLEAIGTTQTIRDATELAERVRQVEEQIARLQKEPADAP